MNMTLHIKHTRIAIGSLVSALLLSACGTGSSPSGQSSNSPSSDGSSPAATTSQAGKETPNAVPRIVVATEGGATVLDAETLEIEGTVTVPENDLLTAAASNGRHVYLASPKSELTHVLDSGTYASAHGEHAHFYVKNPSLLEMKIEGKKPVHVVSHDGYTAVFDDTSGEVSWFREAGLIAGALDMHTISAGRPHHGVAVPVGDQLLVSIPSPVADEALPIGVLRLNAQGQEVERSEQCPKLHGEATLKDGTAVFGCAETVLVMGKEGSRSIPVPADGKARIGTLVASHESDVVLGNYSEGKVSLINLTTNSVSIVDLPAPAVAMTRSAHGDGVVLLATGELVVIDVKAGVIEATIPAIGPVDMTKNQGHQPVMPKIAAVGDSIAVTNPTESALSLISLSGDQGPRTVKIQGVPIGIVATNDAHQEAHAD